EEAKLRVVGVEPDEKKREIFKKRLEEMHEKQRLKGIPVRKGAIRLTEEAYGGEDKRVGELGKFDEVTCFFCITFFKGKALDALIENIAKVLIPGGVLYITGLDARRFASSLPGYDKALERAEKKKKDLSL